MGVLEDNDKLVFLKNLLIDRITNLAELDDMKAFINGLSPGKTKQFLKVALYDMATNRRGQGSYQNSVADELEGVADNEL